MDQKLEQRFFLGILMLATIGFFWLIMPFFAPLFWSVAIAIIFRPMYVRLSNKFRSEERRVGGGGREALVTGVQTCALPISMRSDPCSDHQGNIESWTKN